MKPTQKLNNNIKTKIHDSTYGALGIEKTNQRIEVCWIEKETEKSVAGKNDENTILEQGEKLKQVQLK